jgi:hypothetical protein
MAEVKSARSAALLRLKPFFARIADVTRLGSDRPNLWKHKMQAEGFLITGLCHRHQFLRAGGERHHTLKAVITEIFISERLNAGERL